MEALLDPPGNYVLMETEAVLVNKVNRRCGREQECVFAFEPAVLHEETEDERDFLFAGLFRSVAGSGKHFGADLTATAVERSVRVDAELLLFRVREHDTNMPVQKVLVRNQRGYRVDFAFGLDVKATDKIAKAHVNRGATHKRAVKHVFTAHREEERLEFAVLAHRNRQSKFIKCKASGAAIINQVQAAALPQFHLGKESRNAFLVGIVRERFGLDESIIQKALFAERLDMGVTKQGLGHSIKKSV